MRTLSILLVTAVAASGADPKLVVKPDAFETLVNPNCSHCVDEAKRRKDELKDSDPVLMWTRGKYDGGAIPIRFFLNPYRVISDTYGVFVYDPDAGYARGFKASVDFRFHGWRNGVMVMRHKDGTLYSCLTGVAFDGPRKGERLESWPTIVSNWGWVMKHYPGGVAYHMFEKYKPTELPTTEHPGSVKSRGEPDKRLDPNTPVLGVYVPGKPPAAQAFPLHHLAKGRTSHVVRGQLPPGPDIVILFDAEIPAWAAYLPVAEKREPTDQLSTEGKLLEQRSGIELAADQTPGKTGQFLDRKTGTRFDMTGRGIEGELKGWTLKAVDAVVVKWFAWAAEVPETTVWSPPKEDVPAPVGDPKAPPAKADPKAAIKEVAGSAEFLRNTPKHAATFKGYDPKAGTVTLLIEGEKVPKAWPLLPDAEVKFYGWWGRPQQLRDGDHVWAWFACDRQKQPRAVLMLCDDVSEKDIHGKTADLPKNFAETHKLQRDALTYIWSREGLPGTITFAHIAGEVEVTLDHEAMRWGRSLKPGAAVELEDLAARPTDWPLSGLSAVAIKPGSGLLPPWLQPRIDVLTKLQPMAPRIKAVVKDVKPWRERTRVTLVINGVDIAPFTSGTRTYLNMPPPPKEVQESDYPPDIGLKRTKEERIEWFLASIYCTCKVGNDICTGDFYTLSSCNPNGCGMPNATRKRIAEMIDKGMDDKQIFDDLRAERGPLLTKPHLLK